MFLRQLGGYDWCSRCSVTSRMSQIDLLYWCTAQIWLKSYKSLLISGGRPPWHHWAELDNYADTSLVLLTPPYVEPAQMGQLTLNEFSCLITTITTKIVSPCSINNAIANFYLLPLSPITLRFVFLQQLQSVFCISVSNAIKTWHSTSLGFTFIFTTFSFFHPKKSLKVRDHHQIPFLILSKFKQINLLLFPPKTICFPVMFPKCKLNSAKNILWKWYHIGLPILEGGLNGLKCLSNSQIIPLQIPIALYQTRRNGSILYKYWTARKGDNNATFTIGLPT